MPWHQPPTPADPSPTSPRTPSPLTNGYTDALLECLLLQLCRQRSTKAAPARNALTPTLPSPYQRKQRHGAGVWRGAITKPNAPTLTLPRRPTTGATVRLVAASSVRVAYLPPPFRRSPLPYFSTDAGPNYILFGSSRLSTNRYWNYHNGGIPEGFQHRTSACSTFLARHRRRIGASVALA